MTASQPDQRAIYAGTFVHCKNLKELDVCEKGAIGVDEQGKIAFIERNVVDASELLQRSGWQTARILQAPADNSFFFPGFIDSHIHASQYPNAGIFGSSTLLDWLETYTFPLESSFSDISRADAVYNTVVRRTLAHGTTTAAYYATIHVPATNLLADICYKLGQRAFIGRCCMDRMAPDHYLDENTEAVIQKTRDVMAHCQKIDPEGKIVNPIITPRFAPSCVNETLTALGKLQAETGARVQTHISENKGEIELVKELFPKSKHYADVYDSYGLLGDKTILAHAVHLTKDEQRVISERRAKISHCPASNMALTSGCCHVRQLLDEGIEVGLGTDVSGGWSPSILEVVRMAGVNSKTIALSVGEQAKLTVEETLWLATRGGAKVVAMDGLLGGFEVGMLWDAQLIGLGQSRSSPPDHNILAQSGPVDVFGWECINEKVHKWVWGGDDRNTLAVWVNGRLVHTRSGIKI